MICYNYEREGWVDDKDENFFIDMSPEGGLEETEQEFKDREEFYKWYNN